MQNAYSVSDYYQGPFQEADLQRWAEALRARLDVPEISLGLLFVSPQLFLNAEEILEILRVHAQVPLLVGCSGRSLIVGSQEREATPGLVLGLYYLPGARLRPCRFGQAEVEACQTEEAWRQALGLADEGVNSWLVLADPFHMDCESWLKSWNSAFPEIPILGGLASGDPHAQATQLYLNGQIHDEGGIALALGGSVTLHGIISQGCTPIGDTWTITKADRNFVHEIGNRPAYKVLEETFQNLSETEQRQARGNLFIGLVSNEYRDEFGRGDFLIRNLIGVDPTSGTLAVGAYPRPGQTLQFQIRDAATSSEDMALHLTRAQRALQGRRLYGACLFSCNGRGQHLFGAPHHDPEQVQTHLGPFGLAGFFCNGEIGPVGSENFLHGYTASLAVFVDHPAPSPGTETAA